MSNDFDQERYLDAILAAGNKGFDAGWNTLAGDVRGILSLKIDDHEKIKLIKAATIPLNRS